MNKIELEERVSFLEANLLSLLNDLEETHPEVVEKCLAKPEFQQIITTQKALVRDIPNLTKYLHPKSHMITRRID